MSGSSLLSHGETPHYHRRYGVSLLSSAWGQVGPPRYCRQTNSVCSRLVFSSLNQNVNLKQAVCPSPFGFSRSLKNNSISLKHLRCCQVKPHGSLVLVSSTYRYATLTHPTYQRLSLKRSFRTLKESGKTHLKASFPLRCFQRLSLPHLATGQCHWHDNPNTSGASTPVLSY